MNLYISDLDGTFINHSCKLTENSKEKLKRLIERNTLITFASARNIESIKKIFEDVKLKLPIICSNGSYIIDKDDNLFYIHKIEDSKIDSLFSFFISNNVEPVLTYVGERNALLYSSIASDKTKNYMDFKLNLGDRRPRASDNIFDVDRKGLVTITLVDGYDVLKPIYDIGRVKFKDEFELYLMEIPEQKGTYTLLFVDTQISKGIAIKKLKELLKLEDIHITCFGDNTNDLSMKPIANHTVAVGNAELIVKQNFDEIIGSNLEDSVINYIYEREMGNV